MIEWNAWKVCERRASCFEGFSEGAVEKSKYRDISSCARSAKG